MDEDASKIKKKSKSGPLKSSPGFLKCMRSVYLYFKEEKEKGALNIPINSFIERTAVACGVGRKTLYNYAKKGLFNDPPTILQPKKKKKKKMKAAGNGTQESNRGRLEPVIVSPKKKYKSVQVQTQQNNNSVTPNATPCITTMAPPNNRLNEIGKEKFCEIKSEEVSGHWASGSTRRDISYFTKNNIWHNVYSIPSSDVSSCSAELTQSRIGNCEPGSSDLTNL